MRHRKGPKRVSGLSRDRAPSQELDNCGLGERIRWASSASPETIKELFELSSLKVPQRNSDVPKVFSTTGAPEEKMLQLWGRETIVDTEKPHQRGWGNHLGPKCSRL